MKHSLSQQPVFRHRLGVDLQSRFQVLMPQNLLDRLDIDFRLHQHRGQRSSEGVKTEGTRWRTTPAFLAAFVLLPSRIEYQVVGVHAADASRHVPSRRRAKRRLIRCGRLGRADHGHTSRALPTSAGNHAQRNSGVTLPSIRKLHRAHHMSGGIDGRCTRGLCSTGVDHAACRVEIFRLVCWSGYRAGWIARISRSCSQ